MKSILLVDGYNVIGTWQEAVKNNWPIDECRDRLIDLLQEYGSFTNRRVILVFDGYKGERLFTSIEKRNNIEIVFTKKDETADHYIEKTVYNCPVYYKVEVATSDALQQTSVLGNGAIRISSRELLQSICSYKDNENKLNQANKNYIRDNIASRLTQQQLNKLEKLRRPDSRK